jgi:rubrerythrin
MSLHPSAQKIANLADLLALAYQIEADAVERYRVLADQMETHNNPDLVKVFRDLARAEDIHANEIKRLAGDIDPVAHARKLGGWKGGESPEEVDLSAAHYMMTPWHALQMALAGEQRALAFFKDIVETTADDTIKKMAAEFVEEEAEHVNLVHRLLRRYPAPSETWSEDPDPAVSLE